MTDRRFATGLATAMALIYLTAAPAQASAIQRACISSERSSASPELCRCIQSVANRTLSRSDRRLTAKFFRDPDRAQEIRVSDRPSDDAFWERYERFSQRVANSCN